MTPLAMSPKHEKLSLLEVRGGCGLRRRLEALGFVPGAILSVISAGDCGPIIVNIKSTRLAIGRGVAHQIIVQPVQHQEGETLYG